MNPAKLRTCVIGLGFIGMKRLKSLPKECLLVGVYDPDTKISEKTLNELGVRLFPSTEELLNEVGDGGLAIIATPHNCLGSLTRDALSKGLHVLVEKPGSSSALEMGKTVALGHSQNRLVRVGYNHRFHPSLLDAKKIVDSKRFGGVQFIRARYGHGGRPGYEKEWRAKREISGGGELIDQGSHLLDLTRFLCGEISVEFSDLPTIYWNMDVEDNAIIYGALMSGGKFLLHASWTEWKNIFSFEIFLKTAKIEISGLGGSYGTEKLTVFDMPDGLGVPNATITEYQNTDNSWRLEMEDVINAISHKFASGATGEDSLKILEIISEAYSK